MFAADVDGDGYAYGVNWLVNANACYTLNMADSYGDGWSGNAIRHMKIEHWLVQTSMVLLWSSIEDHCIAATTTAVEFVFVDGTWNTECGFSIDDANELRY